MAYSFNPCRGRQIPEFQVSVPYSEFQDSHDYMTEKTCLEKQKSDPPTKRKGWELQLSWQSACLED